MSTPTVFKMFWYLRFKRSSLYYIHSINNSIPFIVVHVKNSNFVLP